jgi:murein DD-endopeptidase MepM/ murein hydrolase activator NlpD
MKNWNFLAEHYKLTNPLRYMQVNQGFGANNLDVYKKWGMLGHNGLDLRASTGTDVTASHSGLVTYSGEDNTGGLSVRIQADSVFISGKRYSIETIYYHLEKCLVRAGELVETGQLVGKADNTGVSTGSHLHFALKPLFWENGWQKDYENGYKGCIDPLPFLKDAQFDKLPIDERYGREKVWSAEFQMRFKNTWLHRQFFSRLKRHPDSITNRELNALVYGSWDFETVFLNPTMAIHWMVQTKQDYLDKKPRPKPFDEHIYRLS